MRFTPRLSEAAVRKEAVRMMTKMAEVRAAEEHKAQLKKEKELAEQASVSIKSVLRLLKYCELQKKF